jgi:hypothetical protein
VLSGNQITVLVNDVEYLSVIDPNPFANGHIGLYTDGAAVAYKNLNVTLG